MTNTDGTGRGLLDDLVEIEELAQKLGVDVKTLRNRISRGVFPRGLRLPGSSVRYYRRSEIEAWLAENLEE